MNESAETTLRKLDCWDIQFDQDDLDQLPDTLSMMIEEAGLEPAIRIWVKLQAQNHYFPTLPRALAPLIHKKVLTDPDNLSPLELAVKYGYSKQHIYKLKGAISRKGKAA